MMLIRDVIRDRAPYSMKASATVQDAAEFMASRNVGAVSPRKPGLVELSARKLSGAGEMHAPICAP